MRGVPRRPFAGLDDAEREAKRLNDKLRATDKRLKKCVVIIHMDGSNFLWQRAFLVRWKGFVIVLSEHHRPAVYHKEDLVEIAQHARATPRSWLKHVLPEKAAREGAAMMRTSARARRRGR